MERNDERDISGSEQRHRWSLPSDIASGYHGGVAVVARGKNDARAKTPSTQNFFYPTLNLVRFASLRE